MGAGRRTRSMRGPPAQSTLRACRAPARLMRHEGLAATACRPGKAGLARRAGGSADSATGSKAAAAGVAKTGLAAMALRLTAGRKATVVATGRAAEPALAAIALVTPRATPAAKVGAA